MATQSYQFLYRDLLYKMSKISWTYSIYIHKFILLYTTNNTVNILHSFFLLFIHTKYTSVIHYSRREDNHSCRLPLLLTPGLRIRLLVTRIRFRPSTKTGSGQIKLTHWLIIIERKVHFRGILNHDIQTESGIRIWPKPQDPHPLLVTLYVPENMSLQHQRWTQNRVS